VAGIVCSLAFNMTNRLVVGHAFKALDAFDEAFYELAMPRPLDADVQMICQKQDDGTNLQHAADQISSQMAGAVEMAVSRAVHPLTMSLDNFIQGTSREQTEGVQRLVNQFVKQMNLSMNGQFTALADTLSLLNQNQAVTHQNLQRTLTVAETLVDDMKHLQLEARRGSSGAADVDAAVRQEELLTLLSQTARQQAASTEAIQKAQAETLAAFKELNANLLLYRQPTNAAQAAGSPHRTHETIGAQPAQEDVKTHGVKGRTLAETTEGA
jgi:hypothetical protein